MASRRDVIRAAALLSGLLLPSGAMASLPSAPPAGSGTSTGADRAGPWVYWYWLDANITREGIVADLDAMHDAGIVGVFLFNIGGLSPATRVSTAVETTKNEWWELANFAVARAKGHGMTVAMNVCDGWGTAGGAWITPEHSMQELVWTETLARAGDGPLLPRPTVRENYYLDVATFAFPVPNDWDTTSDRRAVITTSWPIADPSRLAAPDQQSLVVEADSAGWIRFDLDAPLTLRSLTVRTPSVPILPFLSLGYNGAANSLRVEASDDGRTFRAVCDLAQPTLGWQANLTTLTHAIPPTTARCFRFCYEPARVVLGEGDGRFPVTPNLALASMTLASRPVVDQLPVRSGSAWGFAAPMSATALPDRICIDPAAIVDLTGLLRPDGRLDWDVPAGRWAILRIGTTSTGKRTEPSGLAGGLEADKFNPAAATLQFDGWFGEARSRLGEDALRVFHIDSWECRGQTWSPVFAQGFAQRRGYDIRSHLPILAGVPVGSAERCERFLFDFRRTIADLVADNFLGTLGRLAHKAGCLFSAQALNASFPCEGMATHRDVDLPSGEFWRNQPADDKPSDVREAISASRLYGRQLACAEAWTGGLDWGEHPYVFKKQGDAHFAEGINRLILHVWPHQAFPRRRKPGVTLFGIGAFFGEHQPWWPMAGAWIDYISRCQALLQQGRAVVDLCYYGGDEIPSRALRPDQLDPPLPMGHCYDTMNRDALLRLASVERGRIVLPGGASYAVFVLPRRVILTIPSLRKIEALVLGGATVTGSRPMLRHSLAETPRDIAEAEAIVERLWGGAEPAISDRLATAAAGRGDVDLPASVLWTHRRAGSRDIYFLTNQGADVFEGEGWFRVPRPDGTDGMARLYDAVADCWTLVPSQSEDHGQKVALRLEPTQSLFVVFDDARFPRFKVRTGVRIVERNGQLMEELRSEHAGTAVAKPVTIGGPWRVRFPLPSGVHTITLDRARSWSELPDPDLRHFSGRARYRAIFDFRPVEGVDWELGCEAFADIMRVWINGGDLGVLWVPHTVLDATAALRPGRNQIMVEVANSWRNRLIGDADKPESERETWILGNKLGDFGPVPVAADSQLLPAGLLAPVVLRPVLRRAWENSAARTSDERTSDQ